MYYWTDAPQHGIYLFYIIKQITTQSVCLFQNSAAIQNEAISLVAMRSKELWFVEKNCSLVLTEIWFEGRSSWNENLQRKQNWTAKSTNLENHVSFCRRSSPVSRKAWTLPWKLQELKKLPRKTSGCGQPRRHLIRVLNERSVNNGRDFCLLWLVILNSVWYCVGDTF